MNLGTALYKELQEQQRTKRFLIAVVVLAAFGLMSPLLAKMMPQIFAMIPEGELIASIIPEPTIQDAVAQFMKNTTQFGVILALLFSMGAVAGEKEKGTAAMILSKPMPRGSFLAAKFLALTITFLAALLCAAAGDYYYTYVLFDALPLIPFLQAIGLLLVYMMVYSAITLFFSTLTRTQFIAIGAGFGFVILFGILSGLPGIGKYIPEGLIANASALMNGTPIESWGSLWVSLGLIAVSLLGSWLVFRKQEL